jgi:hypothetical protein
MDRFRGVAPTVTDAVVISGATPVSTGQDTPTALLVVPELVDVAIVDPGTGVQVVLNNLSDAPLRVAAEGVGDLSVPPAAGAAVPLRPEPGGARLHLQALSPVQSRVVMIVITVELSDEGPIAVGQAIDAPTC